MTAANQSFMKRFTTFALLGLLTFGLGTTAEGKTIVPSSSTRNTGTREKGKTVDKMRLPRRAAEDGAIWRPQTEKEYFLDWETDDWTLSNTVSSEYDEKGQPLKVTTEGPEDHLDVVIYTWNENGLMTSNIEQLGTVGKEELENTSMLKLEYDEKVPDFIISSQQYSWENENWVPYNSYKQDITRDASGNVTLMEKTRIYNGAPDPTSSYRIVVEYGDDGKASKIVTSNVRLDYDTEEYYWKTGDVYEDIVWENTDGQILGVGIDDLYLGPNRIKSATATIDGKIRKINVTYSGENYVMNYSENVDPNTVYLPYYPTEGEEEEVKKPNRIAVTRTYKILDFSATPNNHGENGEEIIIKTDYLNDDELIVSEELKDTFIHDGYGVLIEDSSIHSVGDYSEVYFKLLGEVEYDAKEGYPLSLIMTHYDFDTGEMYPMHKREYSDYIDASKISSGVQNVGISSEGEVKYYNLQGHRVLNPAKGIYIRVQDGKSRKIML